MQKRIKGLQEEATACSEVQRIDLACVFWVSLALLVSSSHFRALLGGELTRAQGKARRGRADSREGWKLLDFRTSGLSLDLPLLWVGRSSKLGIEGSGRKGQGGNTNPSSPITQPWLSLEFLCHSAASCCFSRAALTSLGASFLTCTSQCPAEERGAAVAVEWEPCSVAESAMAVPSAGLSLSACLCLLSVEYTGPGVPGHLRIAKSEPVWGRTNTLQGPRINAGEAGPIRLGVFVGSLTLLLRLCLSHWIPAVPQSSSEPLIVFRALVPLCSSLCYHLLIESQPPH